MAKRFLPAQLPPLVLCLCSLIVAVPARARTIRDFWIPQTVGSKPGRCQFESRQHITLNKKAGDVPGQFYEYGIGIGCHVVQVETFSFQASLDWREAFDIVSTRATDPLQAGARLVYDGEHGYDERRGFSAAIGFDDWGLNPGENDHNIIYLMAQHRAADWRAAIGYYAGNKRLLVNGSGRSDSRGALFGVWRQMGRSAFGFEYQSGQNRYGYGFAGVKLQWTPQSSIAFAYGLANERNALRDWLLVRVTIE